MDRLVPGQLLAGRYTLLEELGRGGEGVVWLARDRNGGELAIKLLPAADAPALAAELDHAAAPVRRLAHPGIVRIRDVQAASPWVVVAMDAVPGATTLGKLRGAGQTDILVALRDVAEALQYAHAQGVVHGDLKAGNVLLDSAGRPRLMDFGRKAAGASLSGLSPERSSGGPPSIADDVYSFGALLYDLLAGQPPFHPHITPERIRNEAPVLPAVDGAGQPIGPGLAKLLASLLEKSPARRPAGMGSVRLALDDLLAADRERVPAPTAAGGVSGAAESVAAPRRHRSSLPAPWVMGGLALLVALAVLVVVYLPRVVSERGPLVVAPTEVPIEVPKAAADAPVTPPPVVVDRATADQALSAWMKEEETSKGAGLERWSAEIMAEARGTAGKADDRYKARDFGGAQAGYQEATRQLEAERGRGPALVKAAVEEGEAALVAGNAPGAAAAFKRALQISPEDPAARRGASRAESLPAVLLKMREAQTKESAGDTTQAANDYAAVLALDGAWTPARVALDRIRGQQSAARFESAMARAVAAAGRGDSATAKAAANEALAIRPGDPGARGVLTQAEAGEKSARLGSGIAEATALEAAERWAQAADRYRELLKSDGSLASATTGLERASARAALDDGLRKQIAGADRLNESAMAARAESLLAEARAIPAAGPVLSSQIAELTQLLKVAAQPVSVRFESDNLTTVTILKVGALGAFAERTVDLKPGAYVVTGTREGFRDIRRTLRVAPDGNPTVVVRCEETI